MKTIATVIAIAGLILVTITAAHGQGAEWEKLNQEVMDLYRAGMEGGTPLNNSVDSRCCDVVVDGPFQD